MAQVDDVKQRLGGSSTRDSRGNVRPWFAKLMVETAESYGTKLTEGRIRAYAIDMGDLPAEELAAAFATCRREGSGFFPSVAEVRRQCVATPDDRALLAWTAMEQAASKVGAYQSVEFADPVAAQALLQVFGSWPNWCQQEIGPELHTKRLQFMAAYREIRRHGAAGAQPVRLSGELEGAGNYKQLPGLAAGRITAGGQVEQVTEGDMAQAQRQLPAATTKEQ